MYKLGSFEEILKVVDKRVSYQSDFYRLVISRGITTVDDALVAYKWYVGSGLRYRKEKGSYGTR